MAQLLLGLEAWIASLLWAAFLIAWYSRGRAWWRLTCVILGGLVLMAPWGGMLALLSALSWPSVQSSPGTLFGLTLFATLFAAGLLVVVRGLQCDPAAGVARAAGWPLGRLAAAALVATVLAHSTLWMFDAQSRDNLTDLRREAQVLAQSVTPRPMLDAENAAPLYDRAFDALGANYLRPTDPRQRPENPAEEAARPKLDAAPEEPGVPDFRTHYWLDVTSLALHPAPGTTAYNFQSPRLAALLERNRHLRELLVQASAMPGCSFDRDYTRPSIDMLLQEIHDFRAASRYLVTDARHAAAVGDGARAAADLLAIHRMAGHCAQEPWLICAQAAMTLENVVIEALHEVFAHDASPPRELLAFKLPEAQLYLRLLDRSFRGEEALGLMTIAQLDFEARQFDPLFNQGSSGLAWLLGVYSAPLIRVCLLDATAADMRQSYRRLRELNLKLRAPSRQTLDRMQALGDDPRHTPLVRMLFPSVTAGTRSALRGETRRRLAHVMLGLYRFYHAPGADGEPRRQFPDSLHALLPDYLDYLPSDPCTCGEPLKYRRTEQGCLIYGVGWDLNDNGGASDARDPNDGDVVLECPAPPQPPR